MTVLSLCDDSGVFSEPYRKAGYDVLRVDLPSEDRARLRSLTPGGFAQAFFEANP